MPAEDIPCPAAKHWQDCVDVYDFLDQIRLRPGMWLSGASLRDLQKRSDAGHRDDSASRH